MYGSRDLGMPISGIFLGRSCAVGFQNRVKPRFPHSNRVGRGLAGLAYCLEVLRRFMFACWHEHFSAPAARIKLQIQYGSRPESDEGPKQATNETICPPAGPHYIRTSRHRYAYSYEADAVLPIRNGAPQSAGIPSLAADATNLHIQKLLVVLPSVTLSVFQFDKDIVFRKTTGPSPKAFGELWSFDITRVALPQRFHSATRFHRQNLILPFLTSPT